jgi:hypothetical protein
MSTKDPILHRVPNYAGISDNLPLLEGATPNGPWRALYCQVQAFLQSDLFNENEVKEVVGYGVWGQKLGTHTMQFRFGECGSDSRLGISKGGSGRSETDEVLIHFEPEAGEPTWNVSAVVLMSDVTKFVEAILDCTRDIDQDPQACLFQSIANILRK